jgi:hypothetical protein
MVKKNLVGFYNPPELRKRAWKVAKLAVYYDIRCFFGPSGVF